MDLLEGDRCRTGRRSCWRCRVCWLCGGGQFVDMGKVWVGADPGGIGAFGVALVDGSERTSCTTVSSVDEAVKTIAAAGTPLGVGIDATMWWSATAGGGCKADARLRKAYRIHPGTVQSVNSLQGAALVGGALLGSRVREAMPGVPITKSHPKALLLALGLDDSGFAARFGIRATWDDLHPRCGDRTAASRSTTGYPKRRRSATAR